MLLIITLSHFLSFSSTLESPGIAARPIVLPPRATSGTAPRPAAPGYLARSLASSSTFFTFCHPCDRIIKDLLRVIAAKADDLYPNEEVRGAKATEVLGLSLIHI